MGWSWALLSSQLGPGSATSPSGAVASQPGRDRALGVVVQPVHPAIIGYLDSSGALSSTWDEVCAARDAPLAALASLGLTIHEEAAGALIYNFLGSEFAGARRRIRVRLARACRSRLAPQGLPRRGSRTGDMMEVMLGHMTWMSMPCREALSLLIDVYRFVTEHRSLVGKVPSRVLRELRLFRDFLPLPIVDAAAEGHPSLDATDASP